MKSPVGAPSPAGAGAAAEQMPWRDVTQADHRPDAALLNVTCSYTGREASRATRNAPTTASAPPKMNERTAPSSNRFGRECRSFNQIVWSGARLPRAAGQPFGLEDQHALALEPQPAAVGEVGEGLVDRLPARP